MHEVSHQGGRGRDGAGRPGGGDPGHAARVASELAARFGTVKRDDR